MSIEDLRSGKVDFASVCRPKDAGDPADITYVQVAWDALVFIVHKSNPLSSVSLDNVRSLYAGRITNRKQLKGRYSHKSIHLPDMKEKICLELIF